MTNSITKDKVLEAIKSLETPELKGNLVDLGLLSEIVIQGGKVYFSISVDGENAASFEPIRKKVEDAVSALEEVERAMVSLTAEQTASTQNSRSGSPGGTPEMPRKPSSPPTPQGIPGVKHIIAVASGKGGVGKSTTSVNLAMALQQQGLKVGILDADIYGPSLPRLVGISGKPQLGPDDKLIPMQSYGVKIMSIGFLINEDEPMIWRGPMVISALSQMMKDVSWGELDVMVVDMPPGTGDAQLTMAQKVPLSGAVIVSTPQDLALIDARKGLNMFKKVNVPLLGIVENMSYFLCPSCGERSDIFGNGGAEEEAKKLQTPFLGAVPLHMEIREKSDLGEPVVVSSPDSAHAEIYKKIAAQTWEEIQKHQQSNTSQSPRITIK